ncbi:phosphate system positive regulatory protein pho81 [Ascosphaera pollenicola]|nr:phosphate system positive regulatory protein pho81 [Ascosphaera pollenicola]
MSHMQTLEKRRSAMALPAPEEDAIVEFKSSLERLGRVLEDYAISADANGAASRRHRSLSARRLKGLQRGSGSDTEYDEVHVPSADAFLDNTKTLAYSGGEVSEEANIEGSPAGAWDIFKTEIVRLTHTLKLKGWRRLPLGAAPEIEAVRLSGALTNAVYVISPPKNIREVTSTGLRPPKTPPSKLLLRIYGPQVEHLIDREKELGILRRLGKQNIGPKVLGTFNNGRFEQYFEARPLTIREMRSPDMSKNIAKRMRELHDGIELLPEERRAGPNVWHNWDKWLDRLDKVATWLDHQLSSPDNERLSVQETWRRRGYVFGAPWPQFKKALDKYREFVDACSGGDGEIRNHLIFAHNDTQYGNILRMMPTHQSPLHLPANEHRQLVVIDFEYASPNVRGLEFANHFTEWCYNYHDEEAPWRCNIEHYPKPEDQARFIRAYLTHHSYVPGTVATGADASAIAVEIANHPSRSPRMPPLVLDDDPSVPANQATNADSVDADTVRLMRETRLWRAANSAQWSAWGVVQAKIPGIEQDSALQFQEEAEDGKPGSENETAVSKGDDSEDAAGEEFDYLAYAQDRALFFWADLFSLGVVKDEELPVDMVDRIKAKVINY